MSITNKLGSLAFGSDEGYKFMVIENMSSGTEQIPEIPNREEGHARETTHVSWHIAQLPRHSDRRCKAPAIRGVLVPHMRPPTSTVMQRVTAATFHRSEDAAVATTQPRAAHPIQPMLH